MASVDDLTFTLSSDGTYYSVKAAATTIAGDLEIPAEYSGLPVKKIDASGFKSCASLTSVVVPESITALPDSAFQDCTGITSLTLPSGLTSLGTNSVRNCKKLTSISLPAGLTSIGEYAFYLCTSLTSISLPAGLTSIGGSAFGYCTKLTSITVDSANKTFHADGNACIRTADSRLMFGCKTTVFPNYIRSINYGAFYAYIAPTSVVLPATLEYIGSGAFAYNTTTTYFKFEGDAPTMGSDIFVSGNKPTVIHVNAFATGYGDTWGGKAVVVDNPVYYKNKRICKAYLGSKRKRKRP